MSTAGRDRARAPLPAGMPPAEQDFYEGLRLAADAGGLSHRAMEKLTEAAGPGAFFSKSQWGRALNGEARPSLESVLALSGAGGAVDAGALRALWMRAFAQAPQAAQAEPLARPRQLPPAVAGFAGRGAELAALERLAGEASAGGESVVITAVSGTAGVGKTALALHWAHRAAGRFPDGQLYVNLRGYDPSGRPLKAAEALAGFAEALGVPPGRLPGGEQALAGLYRSLVAGRRMLVVLDNARDAAQVRPLMPGTAGSLVLVTSRSRLAGLAAADGARLLPLDVLGEAEARALLAARLGAPRVDAEPEAAAAVAALCARLPLALGIAAAHAAARPALPLAELAASLRDQRARLDLLDTGDPAASARSAFSWSCDHLSGPAAGMFRLLGLHPGPDVTHGTAAALAGVAAAPARAALAELAAAQLLAETAPGRLGFHDLLRAYAAEQADAVDDARARRAARARMAAHYAGAARAAAALICPGRDLPGDPGPAPAPAGGVPAALAWFAAERQALAALARDAADGSLGAAGWQIGWLLGRYLHRQGAWQDWAEVLDAALAAATAAGDPAGQGYAHRDLGAVCAALSARAADPGPLQERSRDHLASAMGIYRRLGDSVGRAHVHLYLGHLLEVQGRVAAMLPHEMEALRLFEAAGHAAGQANALTNAATCHRKLGDYEQSRDCCERALALHRQAGNPDGEGHAWQCLGYVLLQLGEADQAASSARRAVAVFRELGARPLLAAALAQLGDALSAAGRHADAAGARQEALAILDDLSEPGAAALRARIA